MSIVWDLLNLVSELDVKVAEDGGSTISIPFIKACLSSKGAFLSSERKDSKMAILLSSAVTYSREIGARFESSSRNSHFTPAEEHRRQGDVREHLICSAS
jgi:hypothetical protein